eukprot:TRINITY_DN63629_c0_g1_i1.p1 TRINITY_DN63629_c0_g1~~TRINITY_DN63629_c0_g1_i1.p1  ORF type:complete len:117 (-),score=28.75 TRINITY_DN63629_c0_g1_i1:487-837(-)
MMFFARRSAISFVALLCLPSLISGAYEYEKPAPKIWDDLTYDEREIFDRGDTELDDFWSEKELENFIASDPETADMAPAVASKMMNMYDKNGDRYLDKDEYAGLAGMYRATGSDEM